jgi:hypothetical protein
MQIESRVCCLLHLVRLPHPCTRRKAIQLQVDLSGDFTGSEVFSVKIPFSRLCNAVFTRLLLSSGKMKYDQDNGKIVR